MKDLVIGPLHKSGIDGHHRDESFGGQAGGKGYTMLFSDPHIIKPVREFLCKLIEARSVAHRGGDGDDFRIGTGEMNHGPAKGLGVRGNGFFFHGHFTGFNAEGGNSVKPGGVLLGKRVASPFFSNDMDQDRPLHFSDILEIFDEMIQPVALEGSHVVESEFFKQGSGNNQGLQGFLKLTRKPHHLIADRRDGFQEMFELSL